MTYLSNRRTEIFIFLVPRIQIIDGIKDRKIDRYDLRKKFELVCVKITWNKVRRDPKNYKKKTAIYTTE